MLYSSLMNHPNLPTEALRETEHKLFLFHYSLLVALPPSADAKAIARKEVKDIARGVVLLGQADQEIWDVELEWEDYVSFRESPSSRVTFCFDLYVIHETDARMEARTRRTIPSLDSEEVRLALPGSREGDFYPWLPQVL